MSTAVPVDRARRFASLAVVLLAAILPLLPTLRNGFAFDDATLIVDSDATLLGRVGDDFFGRDAAGNPASGYFRPVTGLTYGLEKKVYGDHALGYHVDNLVLHTANSGLLFTLLAAIPPLAPVALPAAAIFAAHPVHAESVAPVTGRTDPLAFLFLLLAAHALLRGRRVAAALAFLLALGAKESSIALLPLLALIPFARSAPFAPREAGSSPRGASGVSPASSSGGSGASSRAIGIALAGFLIAAAFFVLKVVVLRIVPPEGVFTGEGNLGQRALTFVALLPKYVGLLVWPAELSISHHAPLVLGIGDARLLVGVVLLVVIAGLVSAATRAPALALGAALFVLPLVPASNVIPITYAFRWMPFPFFERYLYVATAGFGIVVGAVLVAVAERRFAATAARVVLVATIALSAAFGLRLADRARDFENDVVLFASAARTGRGELGPRVQAAVQRYLAGDAVGALDDLDRLAIEQPQDLSIALERATVQGAMVQSLIAHAAIARGNGVESTAQMLETRARELIQSARVRLDALRKEHPRNGRVVESLAVFAGLEGDVFKAARLFHEAVELPGTTSEMPRNFRLVCERISEMGVQLASVGATGAPNTISFYRRALEAITGSCPPTSIPDAVREVTIRIWSNLADQHVLIGEAAVASAAYVAILDVSPGLPRAHEGLGFLCKQGGNREAAYDHFQKALASDPEAYYALNEMFTMLMEEGRRDEAAKYFERKKRYEDAHRVPETSLPVPKEAGAGGGGTPPDPKSGSGPPPSKSK